MRKSGLFLFLTTLMFLGSCSDDDPQSEAVVSNEPVIEISTATGEEGSSVYATSASFNLTLKGVESYAYEVEKGETTDTPDGAVIFANAEEEGGSGITISSQSGYRLGSLTDEENKILATTPTEKLLSLPILDKATDTLKAYQLSKRCNCLRVMYESGNWGKKGARLNSISPGIIITPLANDELNGPRGESYRKMLELCPSKRAGTPDDVANVAELLMSDRGSFISGSDFLMDGGVTASWWYGELSNNK